MTDQERIIYFEGQLTTALARIAELEARLSSYCNNCGTDLANHDFIFQSRRQVVDTPPMVPQTTEYQCCDRLAAQLSQQTFLP